MDGSRLIEIDHSDGRVSGAGFGERCGIMAMRAAATMLKPLDERGFSWAARLVRAALPSRSTIRMRLAPDATFEMPYGDPYWGVLLPPGADYEDDMHAVMEGIADIDYAFVDCGANYGYWSVLVTSRGLGGHPAVAIEAAPDTFAWLSRNAEANGGRFAILNRAIGLKSGDWVDLYGAKHEARSVVKEAGARTVGRVETLALDDLLERPELGGQRPIVLKLDVEGAEIAAMEGGVGMIARDLLIGYEDHGNDSSNAISVHLRDSLGMQLYVGERHSVRRIAEISEIAAIKRNTRRGYDFFATRSPFWLQRLDALCAGTASIPSRSRALS